LSPTHRLLYPCSLGPYYHVEVLRQIRPDPADGDRLMVRNAGRYLEKRAPLWASFTLILVTLAVYAPVRHYGFVDFDDPLYIRDNPNIRAGVTWAGVTWATTATRAANWHPLTWLSHMVDSQAFGLNPGGHHVISLLFHVLNTALLFGVLHGMTGAL